MFLVIFFTDKRTWSDPLDDLRVDPSLLASERFNLPLVLDSYLVVRFFSLGRVDWDRNSCFPATIVSSHFVVVSCVRIVLIVFSLSFYLLLSVSVLAMALSFPCHA